MPLIVKPLTWASTLNVPSLPGMPVNVTCVFEPASTIWPSSVATSFTWSDTNGTVICSR